MLQELFLWFEPPFFSYNNRFSSFWCGASPFHAVFLTGKQILEGRLMFCLPSPDHWKWAKHSPPTSFHFSVPLIFYPWEGGIGLCQSPWLQRGNEKWRCMAAPKHFDETMKWFQGWNSSSCFRPGAELAEEKEGLFCAFAVAPASSVFQSETVQSQYNN